MSEIEKDIWNHTARMYVVSNVRLYIEYIYKIIVRQHRLIHQIKKIKKYKQAKLTN